MMSAKRSMFFNNVRGISLIDALIGLVIISVGLLAVLSFLGNLTAVSGTSKARAEAMQIAESRLDRLRNTLTDSEFEAARGGLEEDHDGLNAFFGFSADLTVDPDNDQLFNVALTVSWQDARGEDEAFRVTSHILRDDPAASANLARGSLPSPNPIPRTSGEARSPTAEDSPLEGTALFQSYEDGSSVRFDNDRYELFNSAGDLLLIQEMNENPGFSTISGVVLKFGSPLNSLENITMGISEGGSCIVTRLYQGEDGFSENANGSDEADALFYRCFVGVGWYGNVALRLREFDPRDGGRIDESVCVGDPTREFSELWDSRAPARTAVRRYRGFEVDQENVFGIGSNPGGGGPKVVNLGRPIEGMRIDDLFAVVEGTFSSNDELGHDFLITDAADAEECRENLLVASENILAPDDEESFPGMFTENSGFNYCISGIDTPFGESCDSVNRASD